MITEEEVVVHPLQMLKLWQQAMKVVVAVVILVAAVIGVAQKLKQEGQELWPWQKAVVVAEVVVKVSAVLALLVWQQTYHFS